ncbi:MAG: GNAT family N-acetyltransferase [Bacteroidia bacterium]
MYRVLRYTPENLDAWNGFVAKSKNGTFLFNRGFMEYHADRFTDHSLLVFERNTLVALLPAHTEGDILASHRGLTYGGLVVGDKMRLSEVTGILKSIMEYCEATGFDKIFIKAIPYIYHKVPAQELEYALFVAGAKTIRRDSLSVIENATALPVLKSRRQAINRSFKIGLEVREDDKLELFWEQILLPNLHNKLGIKPVHTIGEIRLLKTRFPDNIRHFNVYHNNEIVAGTTVFITDTVAHPQYISGNSQKNALNSLDFLYYQLIREIFPDKKFFDFGISNEQQGMKLNEGLVFWKESYGARTIVHDFYELDPANHYLLDNVLI